MLVALIAPLFQFIWNANTLICTHTHTRTQHLEHTSIAYVWNHLELIFSKSDVKWCVAIFSLFFPHTQSLNWLMLLGVSARWFLTCWRRFITHYVRHKIKSISAYDNDEWHLNKTNDTFILFASAFFSCVDITGGESDTTVKNPLRLRFVIKTIE